MEKKCSVAENAARYTLEEMKRDVLAILDGEGDFAEKKWEMLARIERMKEQLEAAPVEKLIVECAVSDVDAGACKARFWEKGRILADGGCILRAVEPRDREEFLRVRESYAVIDIASDDGAMRRLLWSEHNSPRALMCSIDRNGDYVGYCGIRDISQQLWELVIELLPEQTHRGIGCAALTALLRAIEERLGETKFRVRIEPTNTVSQSFFEKLGAKPNGVSAFWLTDEESIARCEEENLAQLDDTLRAVASRFAVPPRKLLTHVLEYTLRL